MKPSSRLMVATSLAFASFAFTQAARADTYLKQVMRTAPMEIYGQQMPGKTDTAISWISAEKAYQDHGDGTASLYLASDSTLYLIDHNEKSVFRLDLTQEIDISSMLGAYASDTNEAGKPLTAEEKKAQEDAAAQMALMAEAMMRSSKIEVTATGEKKAFGDWEAEKYLVNITMASMESKGEVWATAAAPEAYQAYQRLTYAQMALAAGFSNFMSEVSKIKGVTAYSKDTMKIMGVSVDVETELIEMKESAAPEGVYELPEDYPIKSPQ